MVVTRRGRANGEGHRRGKWATRDIGSVSSPSMNSHLQLLRLRLLSATLRGRTTMPGAWRLVPIALRDARAVGSRLGRRCVRTVYGFDFVCDVGDWIGQYVFVPATTKTARQRSFAVSFCRVVRPSTLGPMSASLRC